MLNKMKSIKNFFEENEEELEEKIKEAKEIIEESQKKLDILKKRKRETKSGIRVDYKNIYSGKIWRYIFIILAISAAIWIYFPFSEDSYEYDNYEYSCKEKNPCPDCNVSIKCVELREIDHLHQKFYFTIENLRNYPAMCLVTLHLFDENKTELLKKKYDAGALGSKEAKTLVIPVEFPEGDTDFSLIPECDWTS